MIVPEYWAEARIQRRFPDRQVTVRRFGWSDASQQDAEQHARQRVAEAFNRIINGEALPRYEKKVRYNGSDGLPIREEVVDRVGQSVVTRNSYGARCLNSPDVFFADLDFPDPSGESGTEFLIIALMAAVAGLIIGLQFGLVAALTVAMMIFSLGFSIMQFLHHMVLRIRGGRKKLTRARVDRFVEQRPTWHLRIYETPKGLRLLAMHQRFDPRSEEVDRAFQELGCDQTYVVMCQKQNCFRARLTGKPWRMGIENRLKPRPGVWPVKEVHMPKRKIWVTEYESSAGNFAACRFVESIGDTRQVDPVAQRICDYHDQVCNALSNLELA